MCQCPGWFVLIFQMELLPKRGSEIVCCPVFRMDFGNFPDATWVKKTIKKHVVYFQDGDCLFARFFFFKNE